jgi:2-phosphosulfolactate phosphatase
VSDEQANYQVRFDWGAAGAATIGADAAVIVWVDALTDPAEAFVPGDLPGDAVIIAIDLRTAAAAAQFTADRQRDLGRRLTIAVVAAGRTTGGAFGYAVEDHLAAGAFIAHLGALGIDATSPEAAVADAAFRGLEQALGHLVSASVGGRALAVTPDAFRVDHALGTSAVRVLRSGPR